MTDEWRMATLGDLVEVKHGFAFGGSHIHEEPTGDILLTPGNFAVGGGFKGDKFKYYDGPISEEFVLEPGDLLVTMTDLSKQSDTLGFPAFVPLRRDKKRYLHNQRLGRVFVKDERTLDRGYLHYLLCTEAYRHEVLASATGTTVKHTSPDRIKRFRFLCPPLAEQRAIAHVLGTLDDKIELNRRMNETLEAMARALFKSWFVDFNPVRAKAEGRDTGLPPHIANLFPDSFEDSEMGELPAGWSVLPFSETVEVLGGGTPKTSVPAYWGGDIPWFAIVDAPQPSEVWVIDTKTRISREGIEASQTRVLPIGTTIVSARGTVGKTALVGTPMAMNQSCYGLRGKQGAKGLFNYYSTRTLVSILKQRAHGSVFDTITRETLAGVTRIVPPDQLVDSFEQATGPTLARIRENLLQARELAGLRDTLLPKLISGELSTAGSSTTRGERA